MEWYKGVFHGSICFYWWRVVYFGVSSGKLRCLAVFATTESSATIWRTGSLHETFCESNMAPACYHFRHFDRVIIAMESSKSHRKGMLLLWGFSNLTRLPVWFFHNFMKSCRPHVLMKSCKFSFLAIPFVFYLFGWFLYPKWINGAG